MISPLFAEDRKRRHVCVDCEAPLKRSNQVRCRECRRKLEDDSLRKLSATKRINKQANKVKEIISLENNPIKEAIKNIYEILIKKSKLNKIAKKIKKLMVK